MASTYEHVVGGDHLVELPSHLEEKGYKGYKYGKFVLLRGGRFDTRIFDEILGKINTQQSVVITVTGPPGIGKTYIGIILGQFFDELFHCTDIPPPPPNIDDGQVTFERAHILYLTGKDSPLKREQVILIDETHFGMGARKWQDREQQELTDYIAAIRSKGYVLILIVLNTQMIDKMIRDFVVNYELSVTKRGEAIVYRRWFPPHAKDAYRKRLGKIVLPLPDFDKCSYPSCLRCKALRNNCPTIRAIYERRKEYFLNSKTEEKIEEEEESNLKNDDDLVELLWPYWGNKIRKDMSIDTIESDIRIVLDEECKINIDSIRRLIRLRKRLQDYDKTRN